MTAPRLIERRVRLHSPILHVVGLGLLFLVPGLLVSALIEWGSGGDDEVALLGSAALSGAIGYPLWWATEVRARVAASSVFGAVAWTWVASSVLGAVSFVWSDMFTMSEWDLALFESVSGFSCTGSTVLADIEANGRGVLMWRQLTQWYGGMGMVVLALSVLPYLGVGGLEMMTAEAPGDSSDRLAPRVTGTARRLWGVYAGVTVMVALALWIAPGMNLYDAFAHASTTAATGGFSTYNSSIGHFDSLAVEIIVIVGMFVCGLSFAWHYRAVTGHPEVYGRNGDFRLYTLLFVLGVTAVTAINWDAGVSFGTSLRDSAFNVATLSTSTGFGNARASGGVGDFVLWAASAQLILLFFMVIGGNVGSTAGGMKVFRLDVVGRHFTRTLRQLGTPRGVFPVKLGDQAVPEDIVGRVLAFVSLYFLVTVGGMLVVTALGTDVVTAGTGALSAMGNMGPALGEAGPTSNFLVFSRPARGVLAVLMLVGRLEIFAMLLMFVAPVRAARRRVRDRQLVLSQPGSS